MKWRGGRVGEAGVSAVIDRRYRGMLAAAMPPLTPASPEAAEIAWLWWVFLGVCGVVFGLVVAWLAVVIVRGRKETAANVANVPPMSGDNRGTSAMTRLVIGAVMATIVTLFALLVADFSVGRALQPPRRGDALTIKGTGRQWWWQIE